MQQTANGLGNLYSITQAKNNISALIRGLKNGSPVLIADRGRPVARLEPARTSEDGADEGRLARLVREGLVKPGRAAPLPALLATRPPRRSERVGARGSDHGASREPVKFWDASAFVPLIVQETATPGVLAVVERDPNMLVRWGSQVEMRVDAGAARTPRLARPGAGRPCLRPAGRSRRRVARDRAERDRARNRDPVSARSPASARGRPPAFRSLRRRRTPAVVSRNGDLRRPPRRRRPERGLCVDRRTAV
jgi:antitoxin (DNA-binding transcriptional repressor) of toxin-antitoxin stability system